MEVETHQQRRHSFQTSPQGEEGNLLSKSIPMQIRRGEEKNNRKETERRAKKPRQRGRNGNRQEILEEKLQGQRVTSRLEEGRRRAGVKAKRGSSRNHI